MIGLMPDWLFLLAILIASVSALFAPSFLLAFLIVWLAENRGRRAKQSFWIAIYPAIVFAFVCGTLFESFMNWATLALGVIVGPFYLIYQGALDGHRGWKRGARTLRIFE